MACEKSNGVQCCVHSGVDSHVCVSCDHKLPYISVAYRALNVPDTKHSLVARPVTPCLHPHRNMETTHHERSLFTCAKIQIPSGGWCNREREGRKSILSVVAVSGIEATRPSLFPLPVCPRGLSGPWTAPPNAQSQCTHLIETIFTLLHRPLP